MTGESRHFHEEIQELLDNRLSPETRAEVERHLEVCPECRRHFEALRWTKEFSGSHFADSRMPGDLERRVLNALDREDERTTRGKGLTWLWTRKPLLVSICLLLAVAIPLLYYFLKSRELPSEVASAYQEFRAGKLPLDLTTQDVKEMEKYFSDHGVPFATRVFDLGMMNYRLAGGRVHQLKGRTSALFVYRGEGDKSLLCQMYPGHEPDLPRGADIREHNGIRFHVYRQNRLTLVFWQEGEISCVLVSDIDPEEVVQLAFAKAIKV